MIPHYHTGESRVKPMPTRSRIAVQLEDNKGYESIYCHSNGYPCWNGKILLEHYTKPDKVKELIALGYISSLDENIGEKHDFDDCSDELKEKKWTRAYHRDCGKDKDDAARLHHNTKRELFEECLNMDEEYIYLFVEETKSWFWAEVPVLNMKVLNKKVVVNENL